MHSLAREIEHNQSANLTVWIDATISVNKDVLRRESLWPMPGKSITVVEMPMLFWRRIRVRDCCRAETICLLKR